MNKEELKSVAVIPARMDSSRFPGKPLENILGMSMLEHVYKRATLCKELDDVVIATCDKIIVDACNQFGAKSILTSLSHERSVDRVAEAISNINCDIVINLQGDEPQVTPDIISSLITTMKNDQSVNCANLVSEISEEEFISSNTVKIVNDNNNNIIYFSREPIPSKAKYNKQIIKYKQIGIMAFRKDFIIKYQNLSSTPLEQIESVDMLRVIEHGYKIRMVKVNYNGIGVDIPSDLHRVEELLKTDILLNEYMK